MAKPQGSGHPRTKPGTDTAPKPKGKQSRKKKQPTREAPTSPTQASPTRASTRPLTQTSKGKESVEQETTLQELDETPGDDASGKGAKSGKKSGLRIRWTDPRIERVIDWLETHVEDRQKLFSDSAKDAAEEGRKKRVAKGSKSVFYTAIAKAIFAVDDDVKLRDAVKTKLEELGKSVENALSRLKTTYKEFNVELGKTGAGLDYSEIEVDSAIYNKIDDLKDKYDFPYWDRLHGFWRTLPNFNPTLVTSEAGQDIAVEALKLTHRYHEEDGDNKEDEEDKVVSDWERTPPPDQPVIDLDAADADVNGDNSMEVDAEASKISFSSALSSRSSKSTLGDDKKVRPSTPSNPFAPPVSTASSKPRAKRSRMDTFSEEIKAETEALATLSREKHARKLEELKYKRRKLDFASQKENHQREREKEQHQLEMLRLQLQIQRSNGRQAVGRNAFGHTQPSANAAFGHAPPSANAAGGSTTLPETAPSPDSAPVFGATNTDTFDEFNQPDLNFDFLGASDDTFSGFDLQLPSNIY